MVRPVANDEYALDSAAVHRLVGWFTQWKPRVVHSHLYPAHLHATIAAARAEVPAIVQTAHTLVVRPGDVSLERLTHVRTIAPSHAVEALLTAAGMSCDRIQVIYNGVDCEQADPSQIAVERVRAELAPGPGPIVGAVARLSSEKGMDLLLAAVRSVLDGFPAARLLIVGDGPDRESLGDLSTSLGIADSVRFVGTRTDIPIIDRLFDVFVLPSRQEACPMALLEAMLAGRAVVATRVGGSPELIQHGQDGLLVPPENAATLAAAVTVLLSDRTRCEVLGSNARAKVVRLFTRERMVQETYALYLRHVQRGDPTGAPTADSTSLRAAQ
jgi:glycosyltransferase involved in cell wall biosynthesis